MEIIKALWDADEGGNSIRSETYDGMRPIHAALSAKASPEVIEMLIELDSQVSESEVDERADIFASYKGLLPIHMACFNGSSQKTVAMLIDKDVGGNTLMAPAQPDHNIIHLHDELPRESNLMTSKLQSESSFVGVLHMKNKLAFHLAIEFSSDEVIRLFLNRIETESDSHRFLTRLDGNRRCALHLACIKNSSEFVVKMLLKLDAGKETVRYIDKYDLTPLQYACEHSDAKRKTIEYLLEAEESHQQNERKRVQVLHIPESSGKAPPRGKTSLNGKSPLWHASKAQAPYDVLDLLMSQPDFSLCDFDRQSMKNDLADNIQKYPILQKRVNEKMATRLNFFK